MIIKILMDEKTNRPEDNRVHRLEFSEGNLGREDIAQVIHYVMDSLVEDACETDKVSIYFTNVIPPTGDIPTIANAIITSLLTFDLKCLIDKVVLLISDLPTKRIFDVAFDEVFTERRRGQ